MFSLYTLYTYIIALQLIHIQWCPNHKGQFVIDSGLLRPYCLLSEDAVDESC